MAALNANGDLEGAERPKAEVAEIDKAIEDVDYRGANIRAGHEGVISNLGSFGERMVKIGLTSRQDPLDGSRDSRPRPCRSTSTRWQGARARARVSGHTGAS
jgi:hypothetical protein